ncbi:MAG: hypothetical protein ACF787_05045 [Rhodopirellula sp. JB053]
MSRPGVVRTGPLRDAASASEIIGSGTMTHGQTLSPESMMLNEPGLSGEYGDSINDPLGINLDPYRSPVEVNDQPLSELGDSPAELFSPAPAGSGLQESVPTPAPTLETTPNMIPTPQGQLDSTSTGQPSQWQSARHVKQPARVQPVNYDTPAPAEYAPAPVRRMAIPR